MLTPEEARQRLDSVRDPSWRETAVKRASALPSGPRAVAEAFTEAAPSSGAHGAWDRFTSRVITAGRSLDALSGDDRAAVMAALHPGLGPALTRWWTDAQTRPYQKGWARKAFRAAPGNPELTAEDRAFELFWLVEAAGPFDADPSWLAAWAGHVRGRCDLRAVGGLLASAVDLGDPVFGTLLEIGNGEHPVATMDRHVIIALLGCSRREGWEFAGRLLLAAQRQEGLRQVILEAADEGHPDAFAYLLDLVLDHDLLRFAAAVRAAGVWLGFSGTVEDLPRVKDRVRALARFYGSAAERSLALSGDDPSDAYTALCAGGMRDVMATLDDLRRLAAHSAPEMRAAVVRYASAIGLPAGEEVLASAAGDGDVRVAALAATLLSPSGLGRPGTFGALARLVPRLPAKAEEVPGIGAGQAAIGLDRAAVADRLVAALGDRPVDDLLPWLPSMSAIGRELAARKIRALPELTPGPRAVLFTLLRDRSSSVRSTALDALKKLTVTPDEAPAVEALLTRASADTRRGALTLLAAQPVSLAQASAARLAASKNKRQRDAAAELRREIGAPDTEEIEDLRVTLPGPRTAPLRPRPASPGRRFAGAAARRVLEAIDEIAEEHRNDTVTVISWAGSDEELLGDVRYFPSAFPSWGRRRPVTTGADPDMVGGEVFRGWWENRPDDLRGGDDALDALGAYALARLARVTRRDPDYEGGWFDEILTGLAVPRPDTIRHEYLVRHVTEWLVADHLSGAVVDECLDAYEAVLAAIPADQHAALPAGGEATRHTYHLPSRDWRRFLDEPWSGLLGSLLEAEPALFTPARLDRWHRLERWIGQPRPDAARLEVPEDLVAAAHRAGKATDGDVTAAFLTPHSRLLRELTGRWRSQAEGEHPGLVPVADRVRDRLIETELRRGDLPTPTSDVARTISGVPGTATMVAFLARLGETPLARSVGWDNRDAVFSHLIRVSFPVAGETGATLRSAAAAAGVPDARLVDLALYAPQWAPAVEEALAWPGLADGVLWLHAHTKDGQWSVDHELRQSWAAMTAERTPLSSDDLMDGAVDVDWFRRSHSALGEKRWSVLHKAAKYAAGGNGHRRAQLFAEAMLGQADEAALTARITGKRNQDAVRALGLLPVPADPAERRETTARRYALLREFERGSKAFGSQRRASEATAVRVGIDNLARAAGYADPRRFIWAVEAAEAGDLADGPVTASSGSGAVTVTLSVTAEGMPSLAVERDGKTLKSVPSAVKKDPAIAGLTARKTALVKQATRVRDALQDAMTARDEFTVADFEALARHPVVAPVLGRLVWAAADGATLMRQDARDLAAKAAGGPLRIAHPADMAADGTWIHWQERLFKKGLRQPFKQVFRELYVLTEAEKSSGPASRRYDGHQVQPRQALALLGARGWVTSHETGEASRTFHRHGYVARLAFAGGFLTPAEADLPMIDGVYFTRPGVWEPQPLESVPPVAFSETMRDVDLVVSVAHAGGVDPEATASTVEMRAALVRETARLLKLANVGFAGNHVLIEGKLGEYSLHLGSGTVHRRPGGALCIIPVGSQRRGRLFLPFADDDPKTAEVMAKVLLLARDQEIKDPTILEQLG